MAENFINRKPQLRGTAAAWTSNNTVLLAGEWGLETDTNKAKYGDGVTAWNDLPYFGGGITTLEESIAADPVATSAPTFEGGVDIGADNGSPAILNLKGGLGGGDGNVLIAATSVATVINTSVDFGISAPNLSLNTNPLVSLDRILWNPATNTLSDGDSPISAVDRLVSQAGTVDFGSGNITFGEGDILGYHEGVYFKKVDNNQKVESGDLLAVNNLSDLDNADTAISNLGITATATELNYSDGVTSNIQDQLDAKVSSPILSVVKTANEHRANDTTLTIDSDLQITLEANSFYSIDINIIYRAQGTPDIKFQLEVPTGATGTYSEIDVPNLVRILTYVLNKNGYGSTSRFIPLRCFIKTDEAGIFGLKWGQQVSSIDAASVYGTSNIIATKTG